MLGAVGESNGLKQVRSQRLEFGLGSMDDIAWLEDKQVRERARRRNRRWASIIFPQVGTHFGI